MTADFWVAIIGALAAAAVAIIAALHSQQNRSRIKALEVWTGKHPPEGVHLDTTEE